MFKSGNVTVMVSDVLRSVDFYTKVLGMKTRYAADAEWAEVAMTDLVVGLHKAGDHGPKPGQAGSMSIGFMVDKLEDTIAKLTAQGVEFAPKIAEDGPVRLAFFSDPDRNPMYLCEMKNMQAAMQSPENAHGKH